MTYLQALNLVLTKIREADNLIATDALTISDAYHLQVAEIFNDFLAEVESAHEWWVLLQAGTETYTASAASEEINVITGVTPETRVAHTPNQQSGELEALVFDVTDSTQPYRLREIPVRRLVAQQDLSTTEVAQPTCFALDPQGDGTMDIRLYPVPNVQRSIKMHLVVPQARLDPTVAADLSTVIKVPVALPIQGTVWYMLAERGEELGANPNLAAERYRIALTDEIAREMGQTGDERYDLVSN